MNIDTYIKLINEAVDDCKNGKFDDFNSLTEKQERNLYLIRMIFESFPNFEILYEKPIQHAIQIKVHHTELKSKGNINIYNTGSLLPQVEGNATNLKFLLTLVSEAVKLADF
jgi:hypothetical protein